MINLTIPTAPATMPLVGFFIVDTTYNEVVEHEFVIADGSQTSSDAIQALRAEFKSRRKDWGEGFKLVDSVVIHERAAGIYHLPADTKLGKRAIKDLNARDLGFFQVMAKGGAK